MIANIDSSVVARANTIRISLTNRNIVSFLIFSINLCYLVVLRVSSIKIKKKKYLFLAILMLLILIDGHLHDNIRLIFAKVLAVYTKYIIVPT